MTWIGSEVNEQTRTTRVRAELDNPDGRLRSNQFGQATIQIGDEHDAIVVPREAVQRKDGVDLVFLPRRAGRLSAAAGRRPGRPTASTWWRSPGA